MRLKTLHIGIYEVSACLLIVAAMVVRIVIAYLGWPQTDSDEGTMGLMALHIAYHGAHPLVFYGQDYMGTLEAYLGGGLFHLFGPSLFTLRLGVILLFGLFLLCLYLLTTLLYSKNLALVTLTVLAFGSGDILFRQLEAVGGSPDVMLSGGLLMCLAAWLAFSAQRMPARPFPKTRLLAYWAFGLVAGLAIWSDPLILPFVFMAGLLVLLFCRHELRWPVIALVLLGMLLGLAPEIIYKLSAPTDPNALSLFGGGYQVHANSTSGSSTASAPALTASPGLQIAGSLLVSLPITTGANALCPLHASDAWPLSSLSSTQTIQCTVIHGVWGLGWIALWIISCVLTIQQYWRLWQASTQFPQVSSAVGQVPLWKAWLRSPAPSQSPRERRAMVRQAARLMLLGSAGLTLLLYTCFPQSALTPWPSSRYLVGLLIVTPVLLAPLWERLRIKKALTTTARALLNGFRYGLLFLIGVTFLAGTILTFGLIPATQIHNSQQYTLIENLLRMGATHIYSDYWSCNRIAFQSQEQIVCSVLDEQLQPGLNRYPPYRIAVAADPHPFYVFPDTSAQAKAFDLTPKQHYRRLIFDGYVVYQPEQT